MITPVSKVQPRWTGEPVIVAASGPSLTDSVVQAVRVARWMRGWRVIAVNDAYKKLPLADILYACDNDWWEIHGNCAKFEGEKWACHEQDPNPRELHGNDKRLLSERYQITLIAGRDNNSEFSFNPAFLHYGSNAGFQAINLALLLGCRHIVLVGFDMRHVDGRTHFFGDHPQGLRTTSDEHYRAMANHFVQASKKLPPDVRIVNATPGSALTAFPMMTLDEAMHEWYSLDVSRKDNLHSRDRPKLDAGTNCSGA